MATTFSASSRDPATSRVSPLRALCATFHKHQRSIVNSNDNTDESDYYSNYSNYNNPQWWWWWCGRRCWSFNKYQHNRLPSTSASASNFNHHVHVQLLPLACVWLERWHRASVGCCSSIASETSASCILSSPYSHCVLRRIGFIRGTSRHWYGLTHAPIPSSIHFLTAFAWHSVHKWEHKTVGLSRQHWLQSEPGATRTL